MTSRYIAAALLASTLSLGFASSRAAALQVGAGNLNAMTKTTSPHLQRVHGWWWAVPVILGGAIILDHHYHYHHRHYRQYYHCYHC
jgi:hypothetical protein